MPPPVHHDEDDELVPIPLDRETRRRLVILSGITGHKPTRLAASLLRDILKDDEEAHILIPRGKAN